MVSAAHWHNMDGSPIVVTENVVEYRKAIAEYVAADATVLEVGCAEGLTTALISQTAKQVGPRMQQLTLPVAMRMWRSKQHVCFVCESVSATNG